MSSSHGQASNVELTIYPGCGKTQLSHTMSVIAQVKHAPQANLISYTDTGNQLPKVRVDSLVANADR